MSCAFCGGPLPPKPKRGPVPTYCSVACKQAAYRRRVDPLVGTRERYWEQRAAREAMLVTEDLRATSDTLAGSIMHDGSADEAKHAMGHRGQLRDPVQRDAVKADGMHVTGPDPDRGWKYEDVGVWEGLLREDPLPRNRKPPRAGDAPMLDGHRVIYPTMAPKAEPGSVYAYWARELERLAWGYAALVVREREEGVAEGTYTNGILPPGLRGRTLSGVLVRLRALAEPTEKPVTEPIGGGALTRLQLEAIERDRRARARLAAEEKPVTEPLGGGVVQDLEDLSGSHDSEAEETWPLRQLGS